MGMLKLEWLVKRLKVVHWLMIVIMLTVDVVAAAGESIELRSRFFYDQYGGEVSMTYGGGYALIKCEVRRGSCTTMKLMYEKNIEVASRPCENGEAVLRLNITDKTKFGQYFCQSGDNGNVTVLALDLLYRICDKNDGKKCKDGEVCMFKDSSNGPVGECVAGIPIDMCDNQRPFRMNPNSKFRVCNSNEESLCHAITKKKYNGKEDAVVEEEAASPCKGDTPPSASYEGQVLKQNQRFELNPQRRKISVSCPATSNAEEGNLTCALSQSDGTKVLMDKTNVAQCGSSEDFKLPSSMLDRSDIYKFECFITKPDYRAHILVYPVVIAGKIECKKEESGGYTRNIDCTTDNLPPEFEEDCSIIWPGGKESKGLSTGVFESGMFTARCQRRLYTYAPFGLFERLLEFIIKAIADPAATVPPDDETGTTDGETINFLGIKIKKEELGLAVGLSFLVGALIAALISVLLCWLCKCCCFKAKEVTQTVFVVQSPKQKDSKPAEQSAERPRTPDQSNLTPVPWYMNMASRIADVLNVAGIITLIKAQEEAMKRKTQVPHVDMYSNNLAEQEVNAPTVDVNDGGKGDFAKVRQKTAVKVDGRLLNANKLDGFYDIYKFILSRLPTFEKVFHYLKAVEEEMVGVIAILGVADEKGNLKVPKWIPTDRGKREIIKHPGEDFAQDITLTALSSLELDARGTSRIRMEIKTGVTINSAFEVDFVFSLFDPNSLDPKNVDLAAETVDHISLLQHNQRGRGRPNVMSMCPNGIEHSAAVAAGQIGYLMYKQTGKVNVLDIAREVRVCRYGAYLPKVLGPEKLEKQLMFLYRVTKRLMDFHDKTMGLKPQSMHGLPTEPTYELKSQVPQPNTSMLDSRLNKTQTQMTQRGQQSAVGGRSPGRQSPGGQRGRATNTLCDIPRNRDGSRDRGGGSRGGSRDRGGTSREGSGDRGGGSRGGSRDRGGGSRDMSRDRGGGSRDGSRDRGGGSRDGSRDRGGRDRGRSADGRR